MKKMVSVDSKPVIIILRMLFHLADCSTSSAELELEPPTINFNVSMVGITNHIIDVTAMSDLPTCFMDES